MCLTVHRKDREEDGKMAVLVEERKQKRFTIGPMCPNAYPAHMHDPVEMVIVRKGYVNMTVNGTAYVLEPNTVMMVFPGMIHSYDFVSEGAEGLFVGFTPESIDEFRSSLINLWPVVPMVKMSECPPEIEEVVSKLEQLSVQEGPRPLLLAYIHLLVSCVFTRLELLPSSELNKDNFMYKVMYYIQQHSGENLSLDSVAKEMGVGRSHLSHLFSQKLNLNFRRFLNTIRVEKACILLQDSPMSIKEVCYECGFESTRTFHRAFLEEQKMTPGEYRERMRHGWATIQDDEEEPETVESELETVDV